MVTHLEHAIQFCDGWTRERHLLTTKHGIQPRDLLDIKRILASNELTRDWQDFITTTIDGIAKFNSQSTEAITHTHTRYESHPHTHALPHTQHKTHINK